VSPTPAWTAEEEDADEDMGAVLALLAAPLGPRAPRVEAAFHCRLRRDALVERRALHELGMYHLVSRAGRGWRAEAGPKRDPG
jgi:hypothetical protein